MRNNLTRKTPKPRAKRAFHDGFDEMMVDLVVSRRHPKHRPVTVIADPDSNELHVYAAEAEALETLERVSKANPKTIFNRVKRPRDEQISQMVSTMRRRLLAMDVIEDEDENEQNALYPSE